MRSLLVFLSTCFLACSSSSSSSSSVGEAETWDVTTNESDGVVHLAERTMDFRIGDFSGDLEIGEDGTLSLLLRDEDGSTRFEGKRTGAAALDLGVTSLSVGGTWTLSAVGTDDETRLRLVASADGVDASCDGDCDGNSILFSATRDDDASGDFGDANGIWKAKSSEEDDSIRVRIEGSEISFTTNEGDVASFRWKGDEMSGTIGDDAEFSAVRR